MKKLYKNVFYVLIVLAACQSAPSFEIELPSRVELARGETINLAVAIKNIVAINESINLVLENPAIGLSADPLTVAAGQSDAVLRLSASADAVVGKSRLSIKASAAGFLRASSVEVNVVAVAAAKVVVDSNLKPELPSVPGLNPGEQNRPLARLASPNSAGADFVLNELVLVSDDRAAVDGLLLRWHGKILRETNFATLAAPYNPSGQGPHFYLLSIDPSSADVTGLPADIQSARGSAGGELRLSNDQAHKFLAAALSEIADHGFVLGLNFLGSNASIALGSTAEASTGPDGYNPDAFAWSYMGSGFLQSIGVPRAWQRLQTAGKFTNRVSALVMDGGFARNAAASDLPPVQMFGAANRRNPSRCGGGECSWHGTAVMSAMAALPDNNIGVAGPAGPVAELAFLQSPQIGVESADFFGMVADVVASIGNGLDYISRAVSSVVTARPRVVNISGAFGVPGEVGFLVEPMNILVSHLKNNAGVLVFAAAGNEGKDVDALKCYGLGSPSVCAGVVDEAEVVAPCEIRDVICVAGLNNNANTRHNNSNFGSRQRFANASSDDPASNDNSVDVYGPFCLWTGPDNDNPNVQRTCGTSVASPFVAGVAMLIFAADPNLSANAVAQHLLLAAHHRTNVSGDAGALVVNALAGVQRVLGNNPNIGLSRYLFTGDAKQNREFAINAVFSDPDGACCTVVWDPSPSSVAPITGGQQARYTFNSLGNKTISATVRDTMGNAANTSLVIAVMNNPPVVNLVLPLTNTSVPLGASLQFLATASDANEGLGPDDGVISCSKLTWRSSNSSDTMFPRTGCDFGVTFASQGTRSISVTATDSQGLNSFVSPGRLITVTAPPANLPPNIVLAALPATNYSDGYVWDAAFVLNATANDPEANTPISYVWKAVSYRPNSSTVFAGPTVIAGPSRNANLNWTPMNTPSLFGTTGDFGNACYGGQRLRLTLEATDSGSPAATATSSIDIKVFRCILQ